VRQNVKKRFLNSNKASSFSTRAASRLLAEMSVSVRVPASTSNLGSGFDTLGLAVDLYLTVTAEFNQGNGLEVDPSSADFPTAEPIIREAAEPWLEQFGGLKIQVRSEVPAGRGLGASAALRVGVAQAASALAGVELTPQTLLEHVCALEHHPDNASPAIFGGFTVSGPVNGSVGCHRFKVNPNLAIVALLPDFELPTGEARRLLPESYSRADTTHSLNRAALITAAFAREKYEDLRGLFDDVLHQPYRQKLIPQLSAVVQAGEAAGAIGGFLSGAGSAIICLALDDGTAVGEAMRHVMPGSVVRVLRPENQGLVVL
jgi:homoserine kinase